MHRRAIVELDLCVPYLLDGFARDGGDWTAAEMGGETRRDARSLTLSLVEV